VGQDTFQTLWFSVLLLGMSGLAVFKGTQIAWRREIDNPFVTLKGGRALAVGAAVVAVGLVGIAMAVLEGLKLRR
jgi:hypothetical protein